VGYVFTPSEDGILNALENIYKDDNITRFAEAMVEERKRFSWSAMCDKIEEVYRLTL
jgi:glycosyltransferase involved in cell wall biosynthesis